MSSSWRVTIGEGESRPFGGTPVPAVAHLPAAPLNPLFPLRTDQGQVAFGWHYMAEGEGYFAMAEDELTGGPYIPLDGDFGGGGGSFGDRCSDYCESPTAHCNVLNWEQVQRLDGILSETIPIHGRGNFPTLELQPSLIVKVVRRRLEEKSIGVRDVRLNGSAASHVLHQDSGLGYKDLDLIFCADLRGEEEFQTVKDVVLDCLLDFLPEGVNKEKITPLTLKVKPPDGLGHSGGGEKASPTCLNCGQHGHSEYVYLFFYSFFFTNELMCVSGVECFSFLGAPAPPQLCFLVCVSFSSFSVRFNS